MLILCRQGNLKTSQKFNIRVKMRVNIGFLFREFESRSRMVHADV